MYQEMIGGDELLARIEAERGRAEKAEAECDELMAMLRLAAYDSLAHRRARSETALADFIDDLRKRVRESAP